MISNWAIYANGEQFELLTGGPLSYYTVRIFLTNKLIRTEDGSIMPRTLGLTISRSVGGGLHEDLDITNNSMKPIRFQLEIVIRSDFADIFEVKSGQIVRRGQITTVESVSTSWISASGATVKRHSLRCSRGRPVLSSAVRCHRNSHGSRTCRDASSGTLHWAKPSEYVEPQRATRPFARSRPRSSRPKGLTGIIRKRLSTFCERGRSRRQRHRPQRSSLVSRPERA